MDFEQALQNEGTFMLREGPDVNQMGAIDTPANSPANKGYSNSTIKPSTPGYSRSTPMAAPSTPNVVPPTPTPNAGGNSSSASSSRTNMNGAAKLAPSSPSSSSQELFYDAEDGERQTNRRSLYRSPGTSSSPDLATLLRKAKERGEPVNIPHHLKKDKRRESPPPLPETRPRSSTTVGPSSTPSSPAALKKPRDLDTSTRGFSRDKEVGTKSKSSVRNFFGKMLGQSTSRERSKTDLSNSNGSNPSGHPSVFTAFPPPVPPLPSQHRQPVSTSPIADVFSSAGKQYLDTSKPLPMISPEHKVMQNDNTPKPSPVFDKGSLPPLPKPEVPDSPAPHSPISVTTIKRRSLSVSQVDPKPPAATPTPSPLPPRSTDNHRLKTRDSHDSALGGILEDFRGQLSSLDPAQGPLELIDPCTPARQVAYRKKQGRTSVSSSSTGHTSHSTQHEAVRPAPARMDTGSSTTSSIASKPFTAEVADVFSSAPTTVVIPPRSSSLTPSRSPLTSGGPPNSRYNSTRLGVSNLRSHSGPPTMLSPQGRDTNRLRVLHRSTASSSEPSLIPDHEPRMLNSVRRTSHQDLSSKKANDPTSPRIGTVTLSPGSEENGNLDARGKELAARCHDENDDFLAKEKIAEWLGGLGEINKVTLHHYMTFFDFTGLRLDIAFRRLCGKLYLKAETQQVDRILEAFSRRYWECNPGGVYGSANIVHAVSYSLLLLNTDLHVAELSTRMSRNQFVRNTISAIQTQTNPSPSLSSPTDLAYDDCSMPTTSSGSSEGTGRTKRSDSITSWDSVSHDAVSAALASPSDGTSTTVSSSAASFQGSNGQETPSNHVYGRSWELEMEALLKEMYNAIKSQQILQPLGSVGRASMSSLSPGGGAVLRNRSLRTTQPDRLVNLKRGSIRGIQSILSAQAGASPYSSNSSIEGRISPSPSFATSTHELYGSSSSFLNPTLGFASNLSHTIIREAQEDDDRSIHSDDSNSTTISISDEELALLGAPWAKEGMLCRKQYWEAAGKRAKDKNWLDVFVVIQRGELNMFVFGANSGGGSGAVMGGGNWLNNAQSMGSVHLAHSLAHPLPPPGYNRQRPHCMVLTLANGGVFFFQAGTEELVNEWVSTCNYWAARTSKEPLAGGVSNMEYGWNRVVGLNGQRTSVSQSESQPNYDATDSLSMKSGKSAHSKFKWRGDPGGTVRGPPSPWSDKVFINDWKPPMPPSVPSNQDEETQLEALRKHVSSMKKDLELHNELREAMAVLYQPRTPNAMKAQSNWEKKSQHLLTEIVKYDSYVDSLQAAMTLRLKKRGEKALERALNGAQSDDRPTKNKGTRGIEEETIDEEVEPLTPGPGQRFNTSTTPTPSDE